MKKIAIEKHYTFIGVAYNTITRYLVLSFALFIAGAFIRVLDDVVIGIIIIAGFAGMLMYGLVQYYLIELAIKKRAGVVQHYALSHKLKYTTNELDTWKTIPRFAHTSLMSIRNSRKYRYFNVVEGNEWSYCDYRYSIYRKTKDGDYEAYKVYYAVMVTDLPRKLPNIFFDSRTSRKNQFRFVFARKQKHVLEYNFDKYFTTYFPENYTIDSMSFIGPDVMESLIDARDYDIEIIGDKLFLYAPMRNPYRQIDDMAEKIMDIKNRILTEIKAYRDERLPFSLGRQRVALQAEKLQTSQLWKYVSIALVIGYLLLFVLSSN